MVKNLLNGFLAGMCISIGGTAFLSLDNKVLGAFFFVVGLFTICTFGLDLFTGKVCYIYEDVSSGFGLNKERVLALIPIWIGNLAGCIATAWVLSFTRLELAEKASAMVDVKLSDNLFSIFILAVFCNILIFIAVDGFRNNPHEVGKYLALIFGVMVFILCGFEHCVANMFYISVAGWSSQAIPFIIVNTLGNAVGGLLFPTGRVLAAKLTKE